MAIALDAASGGSGTTNGGDTTTHTCTGSNLVLYVGVSIDSVDTGPDVTCKYNSVSMTRIANVSTAHYLAVFRLVNPTTGSDFNVDLLWTGNKNWAVCSVTYTGVDQVTPNDTVQLTSVTAGTVLSDVVASAVNDLVLQFVSVNNLDVDKITAGAGQTERQEQALAFGTSCETSEEAGGASITMSCSWTGNQDGDAASFNVNIKAASTGNPYYAYAQQ